MCHDCFAIELCTDDRKEGAEQGISVVSVFWEDQLGEHAERGGGAEGKIPEATGPVRIGCRGPGKRGRQPRSGKISTARRNWIQELLEIKMNRIDEMSEKDVRRGGAGLQGDWLVKVGERRYPY